MKLFAKLLGYDRRGSTTQSSSKTVAKERLQLALTYDRGALAHGTIEQLRDEITLLIAKHLAISEEDIVIDFDRTVDHDKMTASIPLKAAKRAPVQVADAAADDNHHSASRPQHDKAPTTATGKRTHPRRRRRRAAN